MFSKEIQCIIVYIRWGNEKSMKKIVIYNLCVVILTIILICIILFSKKDKIKKYEKNPVLGNKETGTLFDPYVVEFEKTLYMYVSNRKEKCIDVYTSTNGIKWENKVTVLHSNLQSGWENDVNRCCVIFEDNKYKMWYTGQQKGISKIGYAEGNTPYKFERIQEEPVLCPEEEYEKVAVMNPYVIWDNQKNVYKMYYAAGENYEPDVISYAESKDGIKWEKHKNNPIYKASDNKNDFDSYKVGACEVKNINGMYYMFYIGYTDINTAYIMCAKSKDGLTGWEKVQEQPLIKPSKYGFDKDACYKPTVFLDKKENKLKIWYNGRNNQEEYIEMAVYKF